MSELISATSDADFEEEVLNSSVPVLVDFWAQWCQPCRMLAPVLEEIAKECQGRLKVVKVDVESNQKTAQEYEVRGIPTLILFKDGAPLGTKVGALKKSELMDFVEENL